MKRAILSAAIAVALVASNAAYAAGDIAQGKPNFAGTWLQDVSGAAQGAGGRQGGTPTPQTIAIDGNKLTISRAMGGNTVSTVYLLDGTPSKNMQPGRQGAEATEVTYVSKWEGSVLVTTITTPQGARTEKRSIEADGSMKVETIVTGPDGQPATRTAVFKRVTT